MKKILCIYGNGDEGKKVASMAIELCEKNRKYEDLIFIDDKIKDTEFLGIKTHSLSVVKTNIIDNCINVCFEFIAAVGEPYDRECILNKITENGFKMAEAVTYPGFKYNPGVNIESGTVVHYGAIIQHEVKVHENCMINMGAIIGHNTEIRENSVISTGAIIGGNCSVGKNTYIGSGAVLRDGIKVGNNCIIGMGSVVIKSIDDNVVAVGNPAEFLRKNINKRVFGKNK